MQATGELGNLGFGFKKLVKRIRKAVPKPIRRVAKIAARITPVGLVFKPQRRGLRKMVPKPLRAVTKRLAPIVAPQSLLFKAQRKTAVKTLKSISPKARKIAAIAAGTVAAAGAVVTLSQSEKSEAVNALVEQGMSTSAAQRAVEQVTSGGGGGGGGLPPEEGPAPTEPSTEEGKPSATQAGMGATLPILLIGGVVAYLAYTATMKRR